MASITIAGEVVSASLESYAKLKQAWPFIAEAQGTDDFVVGMDAIIGVVAVASSPLETPIVQTVDGVSAMEPKAVTQARYDLRIAGVIDKLSLGIAPSEIKELRPFLNELLVESGMAVRTTPGEPQAGAPEASPSPETLTQ